MTDDVDGVGFVVGMAFLGVGVLAVMTLHEKFSKPQSYLVLPPDTAQACLDLFVRDGLAPTEMLVGPGELVCRGPAKGSTPGGEYIYRWETP